MGKPALVVVDDRDAPRTRMVEALTNRFGHDYEVLSERSWAGALETLAACGTTTLVALVLVWEGLRDGDSVELLVRAHALHPDAKRMLVIARGQWGSTHPAVRAMTLGRIDHYLFETRQATERWLHLPVASALAEWSASGPRPFHAIEVVGDQWDAASHDLRSLLTQIGIPFRFSTPASTEGQRVLKLAGLHGVRLPVMVFAGGTVLVSPSPTEIAAVLGFSTSPTTDHCDVVIVGAGPAGLAAAVYAASEGLRTTVVEASLPGGQASTSSRIRNYLGFPHGVSGDDLANRAMEQAWLFGAELVVGQPATGLTAGAGDHVVRLAGGGQLRARAVVLTMGVTWRRLEVPELEELRGSGVFYGAAGGEARAVADQDVSVVGGGNSAGQAALYLARFARSVTILVRGDSLAASMSDYLVQEIADNPRITVRFGTEVVGGDGGGCLQRLKLRSTASGTTEVVGTSALFVMIGAEPHTGWLPAELQRDRHGFVKTGPDLLDGRDVPAGWPLERLPLLLETSLPGVFAAGDVRHRSVKRVASAAGEGATAISLVHQYLNNPGRPSA